MYQFLSLVWLMLLVSKNIKHDIELIWKIIVYTWTHIATIYVVSSSP